MSEWTLTEIATGMSRLAAVIRAERWRQADEAGLSPIQADMLAYLLNRGGQTQSAMATLLGVTQPTASDAIAALRRKDLVVARAHPVDGRARVLDLTASGRVLADAMAGAPPALADALSSVDEADLPALSRSLVAMIGRLQGNGTIAPQRLCTGCAFFRPDAHPGSDKPHHCAFVDAAFGDAQMRFDCGDFHEAGSAIAG